MGFLQLNHIEPILSMQYVSNVSIVREMCLGLNEGDLVKEEHFEPFYGKLDYDYIMWIDSDTFFEYIDFINLLRHEVDIVGGLCKRDPTCYAAVKKESKSFEELDFIKEKDLNNMKGLVEVLHVGLAFTLVKRGVFENLSRPWFQTSVENFYGTRRLLAEDVYFCTKARAAGFKIWIDPEVIVKHLKPMLI
jgi:GT2 family glycosyltransferase